MKKVGILFFFLCYWVGFCQETTYMEGEIFGVQNKAPLENVSILNLNQVKGSISDVNGAFRIRAAVNDTLYFSLLGYKSIKVKVTHDMIKFPGTRIGMTELAYALEEVIITPYRLTGYLDIDAKHMPINTNQQYNISGVNKGYEVKGGNGTGKAISSVFGAIFNPAGFLYNAFSSKAKEMRKLRKMKEEEPIRSLLAEKFDRETLCQMLNINKDELEDLIRHCNYSKQFIQEANDLQILDALSQCYEEYSLLKSNKK